MLWEHGTTTATPTLPFPAAMPRLRFPSISSMPMLTTCTSRTCATRDITLPVAAMPTATYGEYVPIETHLAAENEDAMIDSTIVRAQQHSAGAQKKTTKTRRSGAARAD